MTYMLRGCLTITFTLLVDIFTSIHQNARGQRFPPDQFQYMGLTHYPPDCFCTRSMFILRLSLVHGVDALSSRLSSDGVDAVSPPLDTGLTLFPPRHGVDAVSPQTRG